HISMLLGAAKVLNEMKDEINGTVKLFFQPAEEMAVGAKGLIAEGAMEGVDNVFAIHIMSGFDVGKIASGAGGRMASCDSFKITVHGKGGHGSAPHETVDAVYVASQVVVNLQAIVSRMINPVDPAVVTCGSIHGGSRFNIIAQDAEIVGTTRCFSPKVRDQMEAMIEQIAKGIAGTYGATIEYEYARMAAPTVNEANSVAVCEATVKELFGDDAYEEFPLMTGSEDAGEYFEVAPEGGCLAAVGSRNKNKPGTSFPQHHPQYNVDEDALEKGTALYAQYALNYLNGKK
ncbi:MAG: amidohydrolase, partial [Oscillospiraceae bacterium]